MKEDVLFKRTPFGGFDRVEVISYIQKLKKTQQEYKLMIEEKESHISKLNSQINLQLELIEQHEQKVAELEAEKESLNKEVERLAQLDTENTVKMCDELVETASDTARKLICAAEEKLLNAQKTVDDVINEIESREKVTAKQAKDLLKSLAERLK